MRKSGLRGGINDSTITFQLDALNRPNMLTSVNRNKNEVLTVSEFLRRVTEIRNDWWKNHKDDPWMPWFRGHQQADWKLRPRLYRDYAPSPPHQDTYTRLAPSKVHKGGVGVFAIRPIEAGTPLFEGETAKCFGWVKMFLDESCWLSDVCIAIFPFSKNI